MPRISREAVTRRETLARILFKEGKTPEEVQARMMEVDVGGGRKGLKMESGRLLELARVHAPKKEPDKAETNNEKGSRIHKEIAAHYDALKEPNTNERPSFVRAVHEPVRAPSLVGAIVGPAVEPPTETSASSSATEEDGPASMAAPDTGTGVIRAHQCRIGTQYADVDLPALVGTFTGTHGGLYCFEMSDGRVFKLYNNDKVLEKVREAA